MSHRPGRVLRDGSPTPGRATCGAGSHERTGRSKARGQSFRGSHPRSPTTAQHHQAALAILTVLPPPVGRPNWPDTAMMHTVTREQGCLSRSEVRRRLADQSRTLNSLIVSPPASLRARWFRSMSAPANPCTGANASPPQKVDPALAAVAYRCLDQRFDLYDTWRELLIRAGRYHEPSLDEAELRETAGEAFELILKRIAGAKVSEHLRAVSDRVGARRAAQGVSLADVQAAANMDFQVVWEAMLGQANPTEAAAMLRSAPKIWAVVDDHTRRITHAYQKHMAELDRLSADKRREWFGRLMRSNGERSDVVQQAADVLGLDPHARYRVAVASREDASLLRNARDELAALRWSYHYQEIEGGDLLLVQCTKESDRRLLNCISAVRCGLAPPAHGLDEVPTASTIASEILGALRSDWVGPGVLEDAWLAVAAIQAPLVATALAERMKTSLASSPDATALVETARAYCNGDGTISRVASDLYCHRNTVLNRLEKFRELTGYDVRRPRDAATFLFAMGAVPE